jgi:hypothetical protein
LFITENLRSLITTLDAILGALLGTKDCHRYKFYIWNNRVITLDPQGECGGGADLVA